MMVMMEKRQSPFHVFSIVKKKIFVKGEKDGSRPEDGDANPCYTRSMKIKGNEQHRQNNDKSLDVASGLFPDEEWVNTEPNIFVAKSRMVMKYREWNKWDREMSQVRILSSRGSVAYFLPEKKKEGKGRVYVDTVIDGEIVELKTVAGNRNTLGNAFKQGFKQGASIVQKNPEIQGNSVFIRLLSDFTVESVKGKIAGELKNRPGKGFFICYFELTGELHTWSFEELRAIIRKG